MVCGQKVKNLQRIASLLFIMRNLKGYEAKGCAIRVKRDASDHERRSRGEKVEMTAERENFRHVFRSEAKTCLLSKREN